MAGIRGVSNLCRQVLRRSRWLGVPLVAALTVLFGRADAFAVGEGSGTCSTSGSVLSCVASQGGDPGGDAGLSPPSGATTTGDQTSSSNATTPPDQCTYVPLPGFGPPPPGKDPNGEWYAISGPQGSSCPDSNFQGSANPRGLRAVWVPNGSPPPPPPPDPAVVGAQAASEIPFPAPSISLSPKANGWVNFPEWLWIDSSIWHSISTSATACNPGGCTTATATATPNQVVWAFGDGGTTTCKDAGTPYNYSITSNQVTDCSYVFKSSSESYSVTATVDWSVA